MSGEVRIKRTTVSEKFTHIHNKLIVDPTLSWKATGLLIYILHLPDKWVLRLAHLKTVKTDGRDSTRKAIQDLIECGYLTIEKLRDENGKFRETVWYVTDQPDVIKGQGGTDFQPGSESPYTDTPNTVGPTPEKPTLLRTNSPSTNDTNYLEPPPGEVVIELREFIEASFEAEKRAGRPIKRPTGFKAKLRDRYPNLTQRDIDTVHEYRHRNAAQASRSDQSPKSKPRFVKPIDVPSLASLCGGKSRI